jgi:hypothetical protein
MEQENVNWKTPLIVLMIFTLIGVIPPLVLDMAYNSDYYLPSLENAHMVGATMSQHVKPAPEAAPVGEAIIGTITYQEAPAEPNKKSKVVKEQIKPLPKPEPKKLVCKDPRPLKLYGGTVRVCEWE